MGTSHDDWYQQRYGSGQARRRQRENRERQTARFAEIKEYHSARRETLLSNAQVIFAEHGISFEERGQSWLCKVGSQAIYYWPKSGHWRVKGQTQMWSSRGAQDFLGKIYAWEQRQKRKSLGARHLQGGFS